RRRQRGARRHRRDRVHRHGRRDRLRPVPDPRVLRRPAQARQPAAGIAPARWRRGRGGGRMSIPTPWPAARLALIAAAAALLAACAVGPDYVRPDAPLPARYARAAPADASTAPAPDAAFWKSFNDPVLDALVDDALSANHDLRIALA